MGPDIDKLLLHSSYNAFKNNGVHRNSIAMPTSHTNGVEDVRTFVFTLDETTDFIQLFVFGTAYEKYFRYLDSQYHDSWIQIEQAQDFLLLPGGTLPMLIGLLLMF